MAEKGAALESSDLGLPPSFAMNSVCLVDVRWREGLFSFAGSTGECAPVQAQTIQAGLCVSRPLAQAEHPSWTDFATVWLGRNDGAEACLWRKVSAPLLLQPILVMIPGHAQVLEMVKYWNRGETPLFPPASASGAFIHMILRPLRQKLVTGPA